jgi:hypothetical protein
MNWFEEPAPAIRYLPWTGLPKTQAVHGKEDHAQSKEDAMGEAEAPYTWV